MIIAVDYTPAVLQRAGIGRFTRDLIRSVIELDRRNTYRLVVAGASVDEAFPDNVQIVRLPFTDRQAMHMWHRLRLPVPIETFIGRFDVFHGTNFLLPYMRSKRSVVTIHDLTFMVHPEFAEPSLVRFLKRAVPATLARAKHVCADSVATRDDLVQLLGIAEKQVTVVYGGVDPRFRPIEDATVVRRVKERYPLDRPYILALGTREPRKNLSGLLDAYSTVRANGLRPRLLLAGPAGWREEGFAEKLNGLEFKDDVISLGFVPDEDLPALLTLAGCFVYPSHYEGFGLPVLEALACGVPVVCGNRSSLPEVAGGSAILVPPERPEEIAGAIQNVLTDPGLARRLQRNGPAQAAKFNWRSGAEKQIAVYEMVGARD